MRFHSRVSTVVNTVRATAAGVTFYEAHESGCILTEDVIPGSCIHQILCSDSHIVLWDSESAIDARFTEQEADRNNEGRPNWEMPPSAGSGPTGGDAGGSSSSAGGPPAGAGVGMEVDSSESSASASEEGSEE